ncbi:MAG: 3-carboxy-cis,cis-muconate cycloisomerase [Acidobacteriaceae bacterium]|nr:3-carboxy-cis,cis-muconate cycloisomerase [Acidobacteriaceae bacterium]
MALLDRLFGWLAVDQVFTDATTVQRMLDFEAALAWAEAQAEVIPSSAVEPIAAMCDVRLFDLGAISESAARSGNIAIPLIKELTAKVAASDKKAAGFVHWGATSQDVIDTATILQLRDALKLIETDLGKLCELLCDLAVRHRGTPIAGRTWMQHAVPIVLGLKFAGWADALGRHAIRVAHAREQVLVLQFGGAAGTLASLHTHGLQIARILAEELGLTLPPMPWHTHRDRFAEVATTLGLLTGTLGKIGRDLSLLSQTELSELMEPSGDGRGGSSTMPQKRNPVTAAVLLAAATRVPALVITILAATIQENERGLGGWHAEWETLPELVRLTAGALHHLVETIAGLEIFPDCMQRNLDTTCGLIFAEAATMALATFMGKSRAHQIVDACAHQALSEGQHLRDVLQRNEAVTAHLSPAEIVMLFDPCSYLGAAEEFINRVVSAYGINSQATVKD